MSNKPAVAILVLNWNGANDTIACLYSLQKLSYSNYQIYLIDNASSEGGMDKIVALFPNIRLIQNDVNLLYGGGNNEGFNNLKEGDYAYTVFLNNDVEVDPQFLTPLIAEIDNDPKVGAVAPVMLYHDSHKIWYDGGYVNLWTGVVSHPNIRKPFTGKTQRALQTDYITGCCFVIREPLFREMNGFNERFKMYGEDVDLSLRIREKSYELKVIYNSIIYHKVSASIGGSFSFSKLMRKFQGMYILFSQHLKWYQWVTVIMSQIVLTPFYFYTYIKEK